MLTVINAVSITQRAAKTLPLVARSHTEGAFKIACYSRMLGGDTEHTAETQLGALGWP
jgi:hypothetical protein